MRRSTGRGLAVLLVVSALLAGACGGDQPTATSDPRGPADTTRPIDERLPFDLGPGVGLGGDDVVIIDPAVGEVDVEGQLVDEIAERPTDTEAPVHRWVATAAAVARIEAAVAEAVGEAGTEVDFEGSDFRFDVGGHHDEGGASPETTVPPPTTPATVDEADARRRMLRFVATAGYAAAPDGIRTYAVDGLLSVEVDLLLTGSVPVLRATASLTFDAGGDVVGGYGPAGEPEIDRTVDVVDVETALRRLAMASTLSGWPSTTAAPPETRTILAADVVLSLRGVLDASGAPTGEAWLVPVYRFVDAGGGTHEVLAPVATALRID